MTVDLVVCFSKYLAFAAELEEQSHKLGTDYPALAATRLPANELFNQLARHLVLSSYEAHL